MLGAELTAHPGYDAGAEPPSEQTNRRNGTATTRVNQTSATSRKVTGRAGAFTGASPVAPSSERSAVRQPSHARTGGEPNPQRYGLP